MHESCSLAHIDVSRKAADQFTQIHCGNSTVPDVYYHAEMKFLILLALVPICASELILDSDGLLMQDLHEIFTDSIRVRRQVPHGAQRTQPPAEPQYQYRPYSQAPSQIKQLLQFQQQRDPVIPIPAQPPPNLGAARPAEPHVQSQGQAGGYRPNVQYGNAPQQPTYRNQAAAVAAQYQPQGQQQYQPQGQPQYNQQNQYRQQG